MGADQNIDWRSAAAQLLDWWRLAGVDAVVEDEARDWRVAQTARSASAAAPESVAAAPSHALPATLAELEAWRIGAEAPERRWGRTTVAGEGDATSGLVVLVDQPDIDGGLIGGAAGRLFDNMLKAIGRDRCSIYLTAVCLCRSPGGRILPETTEQLYGIARHHVLVAGPRQVLALGNAAARALLGGDVPGMRGGLRGINQADGNMAPPVVASFHPRQLLERPALKAEAWKDLRLLMGTFE